MRTLLALFAHPDDEAFGTGGTLARDAAAGTRVALVCATRGEAGEISDPELATRETLGVVREADLNCSVRALGIEQLLFLGCRDSGMADTPDNNHPRALVNAPPEKVVARLVGIIRGLQPQVVITFDQNGGSGHPDHIAMNRHAVASFHVAADPARYREKGGAWQADRLFYTAIPRSMFQRFVKRLAETGVDTSDLDQMEEAGAGRKDEDIHVELDVAG